jgi:integrase
MFNDAASAKGGRLVRQNPFARLGVSRGPGRRHEQPPSEDEVWKLIRCARELASPSFAAWLQIAAFTGLRPGELDALRRVNVDLARSRIRVIEQFSAMARTFTSPKNGQTREAPLTEPAREAILSLPIEGEFCFAPIRGSHWTPAAGYFAADAGHRPVGQRRRALTLCRGPRAMRKPNRARLGLACDRGVALCSLRLVSPPEATPLQRNLHRLLP